VYSDAKKRIYPYTGLSCSFSSPKEHAPQHCYTPSFGITQYTPCNNYLPIITAVIARLDPTSTHSNIDHNMINITSAAITTTEVTELNLSDRCARAASIKHRKAAYRSLGRRCNAGTAAMLEAKLGAEASYMPRD
jgi:hypothetical protein